MKDFFKGLGMYGLIIIMIMGLSAVGVGGRLVYKKYVATYEQNLNREIFEANKSRVHSMVEELGRLKLQYTTSKDDVEKKAIVGYIIENFATFDDDLIENETLKEWFNDVMKGEMNE